MGFGVGTHGAEFNERKGAIKTSHSCLIIKYRTSRAKPDSEHSDEKEGAESKKACNGNDHIKCSFHFADIIEIGGSACIHKPFGSDKTYRAKMVELLIDTDDGHDNDPDIAQLAEIPVQFMVEVNSVGA